MKSSPSGLTVIELMIIVAIIAIIAAIAIPALERSRNIANPPPAVMLSSNPVTHQETWKVPKGRVETFQREHPDLLINSIAPAGNNGAQGGVTPDEFIYIVTKIEVPAEAR